MEIQRSQELIQFIERRRQLNEKIAASGADVDRWIAGHAHAPLDMTALATLEGLLAERRTHLADLVALDDTFMDYLIKIRTGQTAQDSV